MASSFHKRYLIAAASLSLVISLSGEETIGIMGMRGLPFPIYPYSAFVFPSGAFQSLSLPYTQGDIGAVDINSFGQAIIAGSRNPNVPFAAFVSPSGTVSPLSFPFANGTMASVAINEFGLGLVGGQNSTSDPYAAFVAPSGILTPLSLGIPNGFSVSKAALNNLGYGLLGITNSLGGSPPYAAQVFSYGAQVPIPLGVTSGNVANVAVNDSGQGIVAGTDSALSAPYALLVSKTGVVTPIAIGIANGTVTRADINASGMSIVVGLDNATLAAYAAFVNPSGQVITSTELTPGTNLNAAAINSSGNALIGGNFGGVPYAALYYSSTGAVTSLNLNSLVPAGIGVTAAALNDYGQGLIVGQGPGAAFMQSAFGYLVASNGALTQIPFGVLGLPLVCAMKPIPHINTTGLSGNNLIFANYINQYANQNAFYFILANADGTLSDALESAAPTRNAFGSYAAANNLFYLTGNLSSRLRAPFNHRRFVITNAPESATRPEPFTAMAEELEAANDMDSETNLEYAAADQSATKCPAPYQIPVRKPKPVSYKMNICTEDCGTENGIWFQAIGSLSRQSSQDQTPAFKPSTGGGMLGYQRTQSRDLSYGGGASYLFTHIHEKNGAGYSDINQENIFAFLSWHPYRRGSCNYKYFDIAVWGGHFQIEQEREISMTGFNFTSKSKPKGWQVLPHAEIGFCNSYQKRPSLELQVNPFAMADLAASWQGSYSEKGSGPFNVAQRSQFSTLLRAETGMNFFQILFFRTWNLIFQEKGSYVCVQPFSVGNVTANLVGTPGSFTVSTLTSPQNLGVVYGMIAFERHDYKRTSWRLFYQGEFGAHYQSNQVSIELDWSF